MAGLRTDRFVISLLAAISTTLECGVMPAGQMRTRDFTVTDFTLPVAMAYSTANDIQSRVPGIATSEAGARGIVQRLVMQIIAIHVFDVLERQGRSALLPDAVMSTLLSQLDVTVTYTPLMCPKVHLKIPDDMTMLANMQSGCIIAGNAVTGICTALMDAQMCMAGAQVTMTVVPDTYRTISGSLSTTNIIMANWPRAMWQSVLNKAVRTLASDPFGSHFIKAIATVSGN
ncbi:hypothetical protein KIN20_034229 [Parelaphostrongylus tenuis]|uniref:Secreted protein n=1 Tax=Parelaphostrongylus tenuis TaxID=148309 RepID=A0AAD5R9Z0_PARTN|nr:hypothetical protein KIN20_034229 [Parelaphostrongylus tenuis]